MTEEKFEVRSCASEAAVWVCTTRYPVLTLKITLSSLATRGKRMNLAEEEGTKTGLRPSFFLSFFLLTLSFKIEIWERKKENEIGARNGRRRGEVAD